MPGKEVATDYTADDAMHDLLVVETENTKLKEGSARLRAMIAERAPTAVRGGSLCQSVIALLDEHELLVDVLDGVETTHDELVKALAFYRAHATTKDEVRYLMAIRRLDENGRKALAKMGEYLAEGAAHRNDRDDSTATAVSENTVRSSDRSDSKAAP